jgi:hypothetical protein
VLDSKIGGRPLSQAANRGIAGSFLLSPVKNNLGGVLPMTVAHIKLAMERRVFQMCKTSPTTILDIEQIPIANSQVFCEGMIACVV